MANETCPAVSNTDTACIIRKWYERLGFPKEYDSQFYAALATIPVCDRLTPENFDWESRDGLYNLLSVLYLCEGLEQQYLHLGIPEEILMDTLGDVVRWAKIWSDLKGELYLGELCWLKWHFRMKIFKLGRLQFLMGYARRDIPGTSVREGDPVLEIHIPRTGPLDPQSCDRALAMAPEFFARYFPEHSWKLFTCNSWLLDDTLASFLPPESNILRFQNRFVPVSGTRSDAILGFVFEWKITREQAKCRPADTALKAAIQHHMQKDGPFYVTLGYICK